jgi:hypothetical protein
LGNLSTPNGVQKLQKALHAKAKAETGYRFYALYDKISREDILAHAYAQCRSNKGAPGVDGQDFADIEAYGVRRWLGELALAPSPISLTKHAGPAATFWSASANSTATAKSRRYDAITCRPWSTPRPTRRGPRATCSTCFGC